MKTSSAPQPLTKSCATTELFLRTVHHMNTNTMVSSKTTPKPLRRKQSHLWRAPHTYQKAYGDTCGHTHIEHKISALLVDQKPVTLKRDSRTSPTTNQTCGHNLSYPLDNQSITPSTISTNLTQFATLAHISVPQTTPQDPYAYLMLKPAQLLILATTKYYAICPPHSTKSTQTHGRQHSHSNQTVW